MRLLLAAERLAGRSLWPGFDVRAALETITDDRERVEHLLLSAVRASSPKPFGSAKYGYLLAGAPASTWARANRPSRLFGVSNHLGQSLVDDYPSWWGHWAQRNPGTYPLELPTPVVTVPVGEVRLTAPSGPWLVKLARVEAPGTGSYTPRRTF